MWYSNKNDLTIRKVFWNEEENSRCNDPINPTCLNCHLLANAVHADEVETHAAVTAPSTEVVATEATTNATSTVATTASSESAGTSS